MRALILAEVDRLHRSEEDVIVAKALGLIAAGAFLLLLAAHRLTTPRIGA